MFLSFPRIATRTAPNAKPNAEEKMKPRPDAEAEAEPWEALDVDDSDLPSFTHPCRHRRPPFSPPPKRTSNTTNPSTNLPVLRTCSLRPPQNSTAPPSGPPRLLQPPETSVPRLIPGPAGAVQSAMLRKLGNDPSAFSVEGEPIPTQEYIRRAVEEPGGDDEDFSRDPWLSAVEFVRSHGLVGDDGVAIGTPLSFIKKGFDTRGKVDQVVGVLKSCTPNGLGDLMVTLKDPTGTVDGSIHRKVLCESEFAKDIGVGAVLILRKVAIFSASRSSRCINVTLNNVFKVIGKDGASSRQKNDSAPRANATSASVVNPGENCERSQRVFALERGRAEGSMENLQKNGHIDNRAPSEIEMEEGNAFSESNFHGGADVGKRQTLSQMQTAGDEANLAENTSNANSAINHITKNEPDNTLEQAGRNSQHPHAVNSLVQEPCKETVSDGLWSKQSHISGGSLPEWTDEQLDELFAFD